MLALTLQIAHFQAQLARLHLPLLNLVVVSLLGRPLLGRVGRAVGAGLFTVLCPSLLPLGNLAV